MNTPPLSEAHKLWLAEPVATFAAFISEPVFAANKRGEVQALRESSAKVYRARWGKFVEDCLVVRAKTLATLTASDLRVFLEKMSPDSQHRYVRLLERVFDHLTEIGVAEHNPARALAIATPTRSNQGHVETAVLSSGLQEALLHALPEPVNWKRLRDRALIALILGAGLRVAEAIKLTVDQLGTLQADGTMPLEILPTGAGRHHRTQVQAFAASEVLLWRTRLQELIVSSSGQPIPGRLLFPADATGRSLHPATVYRRVASVLAWAGIPEELIMRRGARTLRSTYAVRELSAGVPLSLVGEAMGHVNDRATRHYLAIAQRLASSGEEGTAKPEQRNRTE